MKNFLDNNLSLSQNCVQFSTGSSFHAFPISWFTLQCLAILVRNGIIDGRMKILIEFLYSRMYIDVDPEWKR